MDICSLGLCEIAEALKKRNVGVLETVTACYERIDRTEPFIGALLADNRKEALEQARKMDSEGPNPAQPLWGVPITLKDALSTRALTTTAASRILENFVPIYDAHVVRKLKEAGAIILAKNNMDEFAMGSSTENSAFKKTRNPWNTAHVPGGSSGGSAASVSSGQCFMSLGSDTGGSIRQPASFCGCVGLKPTYGRVSRYGLFAFASSLDQIGPITRNVVDCALALELIAGFDPHDNTSVNRPVDNYAAPLQNGGGNYLKNARIGVPRDLLGAGTSAEVVKVYDEALNILKKQGAELVDISLPNLDITIAAYYVIAMAEASSNLARYDGVRFGMRAAGVTNIEELYKHTRSQGFGQEVKRRIMLGSYILSAGYYDAYYRKAAQTRRLIREQFLAVLNDCDAVFMPVAPVTAWKLGTHETEPMQAYLMDAFTLPVNLAALPAISIPAGLGEDSNLPVGIQLVGRPFGEADLLKYAWQLEQNLPSIGMPDLAFANQTGQ